MSWFYNQPPPDLSRDASGTQDGTPVTQPDPQRGNYPFGLSNRHTSVLEYFPCDVSGSIQSDRMEEISVTVEEPWNEQLEDALRSWQTETAASSEDHKRAGYRLKFKYRLGSFIVLFWGAVILITNGMLSCDEELYARGLVTVINAIGIFLSGLFNSLNLGYAYRIHFEYENKYKDLAMDINHMLLRDAEFRMPADAFMTEIRERRKKLAEAPELPGSKYFFC